MENIVINRKCILSPVKDCDWASEMVLNPAIIEDPKTKRIHMIFRATGPYPQALVDGDPRMPYPIFFGYGYSDDGENFTFDLQKPARFEIPCVFFTGMIFHKGDLLVSYGAADERVCLLKIDYKKLMEKMEEL